MNASKDPTDYFAVLYTKLRQKEGRLEEDTIVSQLPFITSGPLINEWKLRAKSAQRFVNYLQSQPHFRNILEVGCGNGWFSNFITKKTKTNVTGIDINKHELEQAKRVFKNNERLEFRIFDIYQSNWDGIQPDLIVFNASIQYFSNLNTIINKALATLKPGGQLHIIDSPFYSLTELDAAKQRSEAYFKGMDEPGMANFYFHHPKENLMQFDIKFLYQPRKFPINKFVKDSPFPWICISRSNE